VREAAELIIGNLNEDGYLIATDDELMGVTPPAAPESDAAAQENLLKEAEALGLAAVVEDEESGSDFSADWTNSASLSPENSGLSTAAAVAPAPEATVETEPSPVAQAVSSPTPHPVYRPGFALADLYEALEVVRPAGPAGRCLPQLARLPALPVALHPAAARATEDERQRGCPGHRRRSRRG